MFKFLKNLWVQEKETRVEKKSIVLVDGDQFTPAAIQAYEKFILGKYKETVFVTVHNISKKNRSKKLTDQMRIVQLQGYNKGKETTDKYIGIEAQKAISAGYTELVFLSSDKDFVDIMKFLRISNPEAELEMTLIAPCPKGALLDLCGANKDYKVISAIE